MGLVCVCSFLLFFFFYEKKKMKKKRTKEDKKEKTNRFALMEFRYHGTFYFLVPLSLKSRPAI